MLYDFHRTQNAKKPGCCHATFVVSGRLPDFKAETNGLQSQDGEDSIMQSSPLMSSMQESSQQDEVAERISVTAITLVQEEDLESTKAKFETVTSIYVHSLQPNRLQNINALTEGTRELSEKYGSEDPLEHSAKYGMIQNPNVRRRKGKRPPGVGIPAQPATKPAPKATPASKPADKKLPPSESAAKEGVTEGTAVRTQAGAHAAPVSDLTTSKPEAPTLKRERSNIFKSFANAKPKVKKEEDRRDTLMDDADDDVAEPEDIAKQGDTAADEAHRKARTERQEQLRRMMDEDGRY